jgi:signal transduction histidine kinase
MTRLWSRRYFRWRLAIAYMLVAAVSSGILATASYLAVRSFRLRDTAERDVHRSESNLALASTVLGPVPSEDDIQNLISLYARIGRFVALVDHNGLHSTDESFTSRAEIPEEVRAADGQEIVHEYTTIDGDLYFVSGGRVAESGVRVFFLFPELGLQKSVTQLGHVLLACWVGVVGAAGSVGILVARRVLRPVGQASSAARSLAEGLLDTRLPVEREDEFGVWAMSFNEMAQALQEKVHQLEDARNRERRFTADVAHELRTPVSALVSEASVLKDSLHEIPREARRPVQMLIDDTARLRDLIDDLMEIARFDAGHKTVKLQAIEVGPLVERLVEGRGWQDKVSVEREDIVVRSDQRRLEGILGNLLDNAVRYGGIGVKARVRRSDGFCVIEVSDDGPGISAEHMPRLFDRFYKADPSRAGSGSGLGLSIALENAEIIGASLSAESALGEGATFRVELPLPNSDPSTR